MLKFWISGMGTINNKEEIEMKNFTTLAVNGFDNEEAATIYANKLPKYVKAKVYSVKAINDEIYYQVAIEINNYKKVTGEINETGNKRVNKFVELAIKEGILK